VDLNVVIIIVDYGHCFEVKEEEYNYNIKNKYEKIPIYVTPWR